MRQWVIEGADRTTGDPRKIKVVAQDEGEAERMANAREILVARVYAHVPEENRAPASPPATEAQRAGRRLRRADSVLSAIGCIYIAGAALVLAASIYHAAAKDSHLELALAFLVYGVVCAGAAVLFFGAGAALRMLAVIGERGA